ncbi:MAG: NCS2 family permease [Clostridiales bacterium]|jgi:AGZA family xanthine/uracil permease-like MFS transporter|nr:NCS2 family permease [Clostridiales bacterium]
MEKFFKLKENNTTISTEIMSGLTTFFAMAYIIIVNPQILTDSGMPHGAVFLATIIASAVGTLFMGFFANVPYALAPGMGLNAFFTYTVVLRLDFTWQEALAMVFICGLINVMITVTKLRKLIVQSIPLSLQNAIGGGIGVFIAYIGLLNVNLINFDSGVPSIATFNSPVAILTLIGLLITIVLLVMDVKGAILISIIATTLIGIPMGVTDLSSINSGTGIGNAVSELGTTFGAAFGSQGLGSLFGDASRIPLVIMTIFAFSLADTFDTIGTFIGTGRKTGIFDDADEKALQESTGFKSKMDKALFADSVGTSVGALFGTSNTTTFVESAAGIATGGRTGLTSVVVAVLFILSAFLSPLVAIVPSAATSPALVAVGIMMLSSFKEINWDVLEDAIPAFFSAILMGFTYSISDGIATGFIAYCIVKAAKGKANEVHPIIWVASLLFIINFVIVAIL